MAPWPPRAPPGEPRPSPFAESTWLTELIDELPPSPPKVEPEKRKAPTQDPSPPLSFKRVKPTGWTLPALEGPEGVRGG